MPDQKNNVLDIIRGVIFEYDNLNETYSSINEIKQLASDIIMQIAIYNYDAYNNKGYFDFLYGIPLNKVDSNNYKDLKTFIIDTNIYIRFIPKEKASHKGDYSLVDEPNYDPKTEKEIRISFDFPETKERVDSQLKEKHHITAKDLYFDIFFKIYTTLIHELQHTYDDYRSKGKTYKTKEFNVYRKKYLNKIKNDVWKDIEHNKKYLNLPHEIWARFSQSMYDTHFYTFDIVGDKIEYKMYSINDVVKNFIRNFEGKEILPKKTLYKLISKVVQFWHYEQEKIKILNKEENQPKAITESISINKNYNQFPLTALIKQAKKFKNFKEFSTFYSINVYHGYYWHLTNNPDFKISTDIAPRDMSSMSAGSGANKGSIMLTSDIEYWDEHYNTYYETEKRNVKRNYAVLFDASDIDPKYLRQVARGFGNEVYLFPPQAKQLKQIGIYNVNDALALDKKYHNLIPQSEEDLKKLWNFANSNINEETTNKPSLKNILRSNEAYAILDSSKAGESTWCAGGCAILAYALKMLYDYPIYVIYDYDNDQVDHFINKTPQGTFIDCDGEQRDILRNFKRKEHYINPNVKLEILPYTKNLNIKDIPIDMTASHKLAELIKNS